MTSCTNNVFQRQQPKSDVTVRSSDLPIVVISSLQTVSSTVFRTRVSLQRISLLITQLCRTDHLTPRDLGNASCSQVMCTIILALILSIQSMFRVYKQRREVSCMCNRCSGWVHSKCSVFQNAAEYRRIHQLQLKLPMGISSPFCNSMQIASATNKLN